MAASGETEGAGDCEKVFEQNIMGEGEARSQS
jgi:hypothetical protein